MSEKAAPPETSTKGYQLTNEIPNELPRDVAEQRWAFDSTTDVNQQATNVSAHLEDHSSENSQPEIDSTMRTKYKTMASQFTQMGIIASFTATGLITFLSFFNDLLSNLEIHLYNVHNKGLWGYTGYSIGLNTGIITAACNIAIAVMSSVNATTALRYSISPPKHSSLNYHVVFLTLANIGTTVSLGISIILLTFEFDRFAGTVLTVIYTGCLIIFLIQFRRSIPWKDFKSRHRLAMLSGANMVAMVVIAIIGRTLVLWYIILMSTATVVYHGVIIKVSQRNTKQDIQIRQNLFYVICPILIAIGWVLTGLVYLATFKFAIKPLPIISCCLMWLEALIVVIVAFRQWRKQGRPQPESARINDDDLS